MAIFTMQTEYCVDNASEISNKMIIANYRATEMVLMNSVHFPKADLEYCNGHYEFLCVEVMLRGLQPTIDRLDMAQLRSDEASEARFMGS